MRTRNGTSTTSRRSPGPSRPPSNFEGARAPAGFAVSRRGRRSSAYRPDEPNPHAPAPRGRTLEAVEEGDDGGTLLIFHHGSPGAAVPFEPFDRAAAERGIRLVTLSRAGFGGSSRFPGRSVADAAADAAALADHLGAERFVTIGWSGGGPHALACAALLPQRVAAAATLAGVAPYDAPGLEWTAGMGESNRIEYPLAARDPGELLRWMRPQVEALAVVEPDHIVSELRSLISTSTRRRSTARSASSSPSRSIGRSATGRGAGTTTTSRSSVPGGSTPRRSASRSRSGRGGRT